MLLTKKSLLLLTFGALLLCGHFGCEASNGDLPEEMSPGIRTGAALFDKLLFAQIGGIGNVSDIRWGELRTPGSSELAIAGNFGACFADRSGKTTPVVTFAVPKPGGFVVSASIVRPTGSNELFYFRRAGAAATYDSLVGAEGAEEWRTPYHPNASTFSNFSTDKGPEFAFSLPDSSLETRDLSGKILRQIPTSQRVLAMAFADRDDSGGPQLLVDEAGTLVAYHTQGQMVFKRKPVVEGFFSDFRTVEWPPACAQCLIVSEDDKFRLISLDGDRVMADLLPARYVAHPHSISVHLDEGPPYLAILGLLKYQGGQLVGFRAVYSQLFIFDSNRRLVYSEILPERAESLGLLPSPAGGRETLLVGAENKILGV
jgi:hypothetical protein